MSEESGETVENIINGGCGGGGGERILSPTPDDNYAHIDQQCPRPPQFPEGLRVLVVDDDPSCLGILTEMLSQCFYQVTATQDSAKAVMLLKKNEDKFDIVLTGVHMRGIDGFKLLEAGLELGIPVVMMSAENSRDVIMEGISQGAHGFLTKPLRLEEIKNIWQHVYRKKNQQFEKSNYSKKRTSPSLSEDNEIVENNFGVVIEKGSNKNAKSSGHKRNKSVDGFGSSATHGGGLDDGSVAVAMGQENLEIGSGEKKERLKWTEELHHKFVDAVSKLGGAEKAVPKKILEVMGNPDISREKIASHLQKYRKGLKKGQARESGNDLITTTTNTNTAATNHLTILPPPPPPRANMYLNNYPFRGSMVAPIRSYPNVHNVINNNNGTNYLLPQRQPMMNNWNMVQGGGQPIMQPAVKPNLDPMTMMMKIQIHQPQPQPKQIHHHQRIIMDLPLESCNFQQQNNPIDYMIKPSVGQDCFGSAMQANDSIMSGHTTLPSDFEPSLNILPLSADFDDFTSAFPEDF